MAQKLKKKKNKKFEFLSESLLIDQVAKMFGSVGYLVKKDKFDDESASWLEIKKHDRPDVTLSLGFNGEGTEFTDFNVWKDVVEVVDSINLM